MKKFATNARRELLERVELQARKIGITREKIEEANVESSDALYINGKQLSDIERRQRNKLIKRIEEIGFDQVMEETAYTWFNRFIALRFMEVNNYLPTRVRVLSSESEGSTEPDMIKEALSLDLPINKEYVYELKIENKTDELFKYLIKLHCNDLNRYMPFMFESIEDYKEILFPEGLLGKDSFLQELTNTEIIPEADWENVEIIGWLYQYYISEEKDKVFADFKKNIKINKADLFAAFFKRAFEFAEDDGYISLITMESWMFLSSYEEMRKKIINEKTLEQLIHMPYEGKGRTSLGINFGTAVVVIRNQYIENYANNNMYISYKDIDEDGVPITFPVINDRYKTTRLANLRKIPGQPIAYWVSENFLNIFDEPPLSELATVQEGLKTGNNEKFIRKWFEIDATTSNIFEHTPDKKWVKHTKGGTYKKWYGNNEDVLMYEDDGAELKKSKKSSLTGESNYFKEMVSWTRITSAKISFRYTREGFIPNMAGLGLYATENLNVILGYLNSKVVRHILNLLNPTIN